MTLPIVARRSPATTTPPVWTIATIVVPCGASGTAAGSRPREPGTSSGAVAPRKSVNDGEPGVRYSTGSRPVPPARSGTNAPQHGRSARRTIAGEVLTVLRDGGAEYRA